MGAPTQAPGFEAAPFQQPRITSKGSPAFGLGDLVGAACQLTSPRQFLSTSLTSPPQVPQHLPQVLRPRPRPARIPQSYTIYTLARSLPA